MSDIYPPLTHQQRGRMNGIHREYLSSPEWHDKAELKLIESNYRCSCGCSWNPRVRHLCYENIPDEPLEELEVVCEYCRLKDKGFTKKTEEERIAESINPPGNAVIGREIRRLTALHRAKGENTKQTQMENGL